MGSEMCIRDSLRDELQDKINEIEEQIQDYFNQRDDTAENKAVAALKDDNTPKFFSFVNSRRKERSHIGPLKGEPHYIYGPKQMADILSKQYTLAYSTPLPHRVVHDPRVYFNTNRPTRYSSLSVSYTHLTLPTKA